MTLTLLLLFAIGLAVVPTRRLWERAAPWLLPLPLAGAAVLLATQLPGVLEGAGPSEVLSWVPALGVDLGFRMDGLSWLFCALVVVVGALVLVHASGYFASDSRKLARFAALTLLFAASMLGLVLADDLFVLFVFWELTSVCSFLLIGLAHDSDAGRKGAHRALLVTGAGGIALLLGLILLAEAAGSSSLSVLLDRGDAVRSSTLYVPALLLIVAGAFTKSAQVPFHYWLPGAMAAPGPVSAFLHSATLVKAGVYLLARLHPVLGVRPEWHLILGHAGALTLFVGAAMAFGQRDLKRMLAYTTIAGLGLSVLLLGIGTETALHAAVLFVAVHALYKSSLFMVVGVLEKRTGTRDVDQLRGLARGLPLVFAAALIAGLSMAGLPPMLGAVSKELVYEAKIGAPEAPLLLTAVGALASALLVGCALVLGLRPFLGRGPATALKAVVSGVPLAIGPAALSFAGLWLGLEHERLLAPILDTAVLDIRAEPTSAELLADGSAGAVSGLSTATLLLGALAFVLHRRGQAWSRWCGERWIPGPARLHDLAYARLSDLAAWVAARSAQRVVSSSLTLVFAGLLISAGWALLRHGLPDWPGALGLGVHEAALVGLAMVAAVAATRSRSPRAAIIALGVVGLAIGLIFLLLGGPDLAMTQVAVDSLAVVLVVLLLLRSPRSARQTSAPSAPLRVLLALGVGAVFTIVTWAAVPLDGLRPVSRELGDASWPVAFGRNVVNVILVDVRALDTLGEIVVLTAAAVGVVAMLRAGRKERAA